MDMVHLAVLRKRPCLPKLGEIPSNRVLPETWSAALECKLNVIGTHFKRRLRRLLLRHLGRVLCELGSLVRHLSIDAIRSA